MNVSEAKRLKALEDENAKLKKLLAEQMRQRSGSCCRWLKQMKRERRSYREA
jgi:hypothetical protein